MPSRSSLEKWSRQQLEDRFYATSDQNASLRKTVNELERKLKSSGGQKLNGLSAEDVADMDKKCRKLERENQILSQKMKVMKHQLLTYTKTQSGFARPASRASNSGSRRGDTREIGISVRNDDSGEQPQTKKRKETQRENGAEAQKRVLPPQITSTADVVRLHLQNQEMETELDELRFNFESTNRKLMTLSQEYDRVVGELERVGRNFQEAERRIEAANLAAQSRDANKDDIETAAARSLEIATKELAMLKEENKLLKASQDRFIASSLEQEFLSKTTMQELSRFKSHVETLERSLAEESERRHKCESQINMLQTELTRWRRKYERAAARPATEPKTPTDEGTGPVRPTLEHDEDEGVLSEMDFLQSKTHAGMNVLKSSFKSTDSIFNRLFSDVIGIVNTHLERDSSAKVDDLAIGLDGGASKTERRTIEKWQKMYEEIYVELEKVRNLLVTQYDICESLKKEMAELRESTECERRTINALREDCKRKVRERDAQVEILENQLRSVAAGDDGALRAVKSSVSVIRDSVEPILEMHSATELTLRFTKLALSEEGLRHAKSLKPVMFISTEFFDFELETTPLLRGPEAIFEYSTVYDLVVSNLLIHYLETDGICVELFEVQGATYELLGNATISLKSLLFSTSKSGARHISDQLKFYRQAGTIYGNATVTEPILLATLDYHVDAPFNLLKAFNAQKRKMTASLCLSMGEAVNDEFNELCIDIHRCVGLNSLSRRLASVYAAYEIFDLPVHFTASVTPAGDEVQFNDVNCWKMPICSEALHKYLNSQELLIYLIEDDGNFSGVHLRSKFSTKSALGYVNIPLFPLAKNQCVRGAFPIISTTDKLNVDMSVELSVYWRYAYVPPDSGINLSEVDETAATTKTKKEKKEKDANDLNGQIVENVTDGTKNKNGNLEDISKNIDLLDGLREKILKAAQQSSESQRDDNKAEKTKEKLESTSKLENHIEEKNDHVADRSPISIVVEDAKDKLNGEKQSLESNKNENKKADRVASTADEEMRQYDPDLDDRIVADRSTIETNDKKIGESLDSQGNNSSPASESNPSSNSSDSKSVASDATYSTEKRSKSAEEDVILNGETSAKPAEKDNKSNKTSNKRDTNDASSKNNNGDSFELDSQASSQLSIDLTSSDDSSVIAPPSSSSTVSDNTETTPTRVPKPPVRRSLMTNSLNSTRRAAEIVAERRSSKAVEFTEPLHSSIPPSETSSFAETLSESGASKSESPPQSSSGRSAPRTRRRRAKLPDVAPAPPLLRNRTSSEIEEDVGAIDVDLSGAIVRIRVNRLRLVDGSPLLDAQYDHAQVFVEWNFLDFDRELCETQHSNLPRTTGDPIDFNDNERSYELNRKQIALLRQWTNSNNRLIFTLVLDSGYDDSDDLCVGELPLADVVHKSNHFLTMRDVNNSIFATLEVLVQYSDKLRRYL